MVIVTPTNDIKEHEEDSSVCECKPKVEFINGELLLIHNSFDGREYEEEIKEILSSNFYN